MADTKISALADGSPVLDTDRLVVARAGTTVSIPVSDLRTNTARIATLEANGTITVPAWATKAFVTAAAPGGGGGGSAAADETAGGGGSSGRSVYRKSVTVTPGGTITAACSDWTGGAAGAPSGNGGNGATLTLAGTAGVAETLTGGNGGVAAPNTFRLVGAGGASSGAGSAPGETGLVGVGQNPGDILGGAGGGSPFGPGASRNIGKDIARAGYASVFPGGGGGGGISNSSGGGARGGGKGGRGFLVVEFAP